MSLLDIPSLSKWIARFHEIKAYYEPYGLNDIFTTTTMWAPDIPFMDHMRTRWNPETRTFHLGEHQFCPTVEDFRAIMMIKSNSVLRLKPFNDSISFKKVLMKEYALSKNISEAVFKNNVMQLQRWHDIILKDDEIPQDAWTIPMLVTMFLAHYLLVPSDGQPSVKIFDVVHHLRQGPKDISGIVLAETLMGLNEQAPVPELQQRGSPFVLYMWLADKVKSIPCVPQKYITCYEIQESRLKLRKTMTSVPDDAPVNETTPWHPFTEMMHSMDGMPRVILLGLERATSYFTTPLAAQFGRKKMPLADRPLIPFDAPITTKMYNDYPAKWYDALRLTIPTDRKKTVEEYIEDPLGYKRKVQVALRPSKRLCIEESSSRTREDKHGA